MHAVDISPYKSLPDSTVVRDTEDGTVMTRGVAGVGVEIDPYYFAMEYAMPLLAQIAA